MNRFTVGRRVKLLTNLQTSGLRAVNATLFLRRVKKSTSNCHKTLWKKAHNSRRACAAWMYRRFACTTVSSWTIARWRLSAFGDGR